MYFVFALYERKNEKELQYCSAEGSKRQLRESYSVSTVAAKPPQLIRKSAAKELNNANTSGDLRRGVRRA
jgi:hypothetical protein